MTPHAGWMLIEEIAPRIRAASHGLPRVGADDPEELYQDGLAIAAQMLDSAERRGQEVSAASIAWYATRHLLCGRRSTSACRTDVLSPAAQLDGRSRLSSLDEEHGSDPDTGEPVTLGEALAWEAEDPALAAARNLDWEDFLRGQDRLTGLIVGTLATGEPIRELKRLTSLSDSGLSGRKRLLAARLLEYFGAEGPDDCLAEAGRAPQWMADVQAHRSWEACQAEHRLAGVGLAPMAA